MRSDIRPRIALPPAFRTLLLLTTGCVLGGLVLLGPAARARPAQATVVHRVGFEATVLGWTSWYGSYDMGPLGAGWCIDHGLRAPDPALSYRPTDPADLGAATKAAMAWAVTKYRATDPVGAAALMLVLHDLRGASYPFGRLDVDTLSPPQMAGFGGHEPEVIDRARAIKADALAHASRRAPLVLRITLAGDRVLTAKPFPMYASGVPVATGAPTGTATVSVADANGRPQPGVLVQLTATGATLDTTRLLTGADGHARATYRSTGAAGMRVVARAMTVDPTLAAYAPTADAAQRVAVPRWVTVEAAAARIVAPPTTTSTTSTSTTSTPPPSTTVPPTTVPPTTVPPTTATTAAPTTAAPTTAAPTTAPTTARAATRQAPRARPVRAELPRTGSRTVAWTLVGAGLILLGGALAAISQVRERA
jgi:LPXTG-motif cell wall-anchored protein